MSDDQVKDKWKWSDDKAKDLQRGSTRERERSAWETMAEKLDEVKRYMNMEPASGSGESSEKGYKNKDK